MRVRLISGSPSEVLRRGRERLQAGRSKQALPRRSHNSVLEGFWEHALPPQ